MRAATYLPARRTSFWLTIAALAGAFAFAYAPVGARLAKTWMERDDFSHGFLIPLVSLWLAWRSRSHLGRLSFVPSHVMGLLLMLMSALMLVVGHVGSIIILQDISLLVMLPSIVVFLFGWSHLMALRLPLSYLVFMSSAILGGALSQLHWPLQLITAQVSAKVLGVLGVPVFLQMQYLTLPNVVLEVARGCSGVNYLISIIAIAIPLSLITQSTTTRRVGLIILALILGPVVNVLRVVLIGLWLNSGGVGVHGPSHVLQGLFVSAAGTALLVTVAFLTKDTVDVLRHGGGQTTVDGESSITSTLQRRMFQTSWPLVVILLVSTGIHGMTYHSQPVMLPETAADEPANIGIWHAVPRYLGSEELLLPQADVPITWTYRNDSGRVITVAIRYFEAQIQGRELVNEEHGWMYEGFKLHLLLEGRQMKSVNVTMTDRDGTKFLVSSYFVIRGHIVSDKYLAKALTIWEGLLHGRTSGAIVIVYMMIKDNGEITLLREDIGDFMKQLIPETIRRLDL